MLNVMRQSARHGLARASFAMAGCLAGVLTLFAASALGLGALLAALPKLLGLIRIVGALYLIWIGIAAWRDDSDPLAADAGPHADADADRRPRQLFRTSWLISVSNPKGLLFVAAFFPQFISPTLPKLPQFAILVGTSVVIEIGWYLTYATSGRAIARQLQRPGSRRWFNRVTGCLFVAFGLSLLAWRES
jgi:threonine/homoserine/homoserine lactone efflux protein